MTHPQSEAAQLTFIKPIQFGASAIVLLLVIYFGVVGLISGTSFALDQFAKFWYFIVPLALGFGIQVGLYTYLKNLVGQHGTSSKVVAVSGDFYSSDGFLLRTLSGEHPAHLGRHGFSHCRCTISNRVVLAGFDI